MSAALLKVSGLYKQFGALAATADLNLDVQPGEVHALIGPNGAGKSTAIAQIAGELAPDAGRIEFAGGDITHVPTPRRVHLGLVRSYQITSVFDDMSALDNVALAVQARDGHSFRFWRPARRERSLYAQAHAALERVGLQARARVTARALAHGERRQLEVAMALATQPRLVLLDEPMAGMGPEDSARMIELLRSLKGGLAILLVEHDMDAVFALADRISVLVYGRTIASGPPETIRADADVRRAYLGEPAEASR